jgi:2-amino-4-hydroxy-6-hydroxymethyldihydropteridine diphosphokinase
VGYVTRVVLSLGSNVGDRLATLQGALDTLFDAPGLDFVAVSPVYETDPVGGPPQDAYLNVIVIGETVLSPETLLDRSQGVEEAFHRHRDVRWGPRTLDVDIIVFGETRSADPVLTLPHPRAHERAFVLVPWAAIDPDAVLPGRGTVIHLASSVGDQGVRLRDDMRLEPPD